MKTIVQIDEKIIDYVERSNTTGRQINYGKRSSRQGGNEKSDRSDQNKLNSFQLYAYT